MSYLKPLLLITALLLLGWLFYQPGTRSFLLQAASWAETHLILAAPLFVAVLILAVVLMFPVWGVIMIGGYLFGVVFGVLLVWAGYQIGCFLAFFFARTIGRDWVKSRFSSNPKFQKFENSINKNGFKAILLARASIICPTNILNLLAGVSSLSSIHFVKATGIGSIPMISMYTFFGAKSSNLIQSISNGTFKAPEISPIVPILIGLVVLVLLALFYFKSTNKPIN